MLAGVLSKESEGAKYLDANGSKRLRTIKLDVTNQQDVDETVDLVAYLTNYRPILDKRNEKQLSAFDKKSQNSLFGDEDGNLKLWAVVNNAGLVLVDWILFQTHLIFNILSFWSFAQDLQLQPVRIRQHRRNPDTHVQGERFRNDSLDQRRTTVFERKSGTNRERWLDGRSLYL